jgi:hypothetical protein
LAAVTGQIYVVERGRGAWVLNNSTCLVPLSVDQRFGIVSIGPNYRRSTGLERFPSDFANRAIELLCWDVRVPSSTIALPYVAGATGRVAGAVRFLCATSDATAEHGSHGSLDAEHHKVTNVLSGKFGHTVQMRSSDAVLP